MCNDHARSGMFFDIEMITIRIEKTRGHKWNETGTFALEFPKSELRKRVYDCQLDKDGETEDAWLCIPSERLRAKYERLVDHRAAHGLVHRPERS